jgi:hypothetical protein
MEDSGDQLTTEEGTEDLLKLTFGRNKLQELVKNNKRWIEI